MRTLALTLALTVAASVPAAAGPPFLAVEFRAIGSEIMLVRGFHGGQPITGGLRGTAEGLVDGRRLSVPLRFDRRDDLGAFGVHRTWPEGGTWVLNIGTPGEHAEAGMVVGFDRNGHPAFVRFPRTFAGITRMATPAEVDAMLNALDAGAPVPILRRTGWGEMALRMALPLALLALVAMLILRARDRWRAARAARRQAPAAEVAGTPV